MELILIPSIEFACKKRSHSNSAELVLGNQNWLSAAVIQSWINVVARRISRPAAHFNDCVSLASTLRYIFLSHLISS